MQRQNIIIISILSLLTGLGLGWGGNWISQSWSNYQFLSPLSESDQLPDLPYLAYTIPALAHRPIAPSSISIDSLLESTDTFNSYLFSYSATGGKITGQLNLPTNSSNSTSAIVMLRGYVPSDNYQTGMGTRNAAAVLAQHGFITIAPDFLGYGGSDPEPADPWLARFIKPLQVAELIATIQQVGLPVNPVSAPTDNSSSSEAHIPASIGLWAHSNGGAIALTTLEILSEPIPTTLWAPVTTPFPYSVIYFGDEETDEGKAQRAWIALFERDYDVFDFSLTQHLDRLTGPIQLHQGTNDDAVPYWWSDEFVQKIDQENQSRQDSFDASPAAQLSELTEISLTYHRYPGADHNLKPVWQTVVNRDIEFFTSHLLPGLK